MTSPSPEPPNPDQRLDRWLAAQPLPAAPDFSARVLQRLRQNDSADAVEADELVDGWLRSGPAPAPDFTAQTLRRLRESPAPRASWWRAAAARVRPVRWYPQVAGMAAGLALAGALFLAVSHPPVQPGLTQDPAPRAVASPPAPTAVASSRGTTPIPSAQELMLWAEGLEGAEPLVLEPFSSALASLTY